MAASALLMSASVSIPLLCSISLSCRRKRAGSCCHRVRLYWSRLGGALPLNGSSDHQPQIVGIGLEEPRVG